MNFSSDWNFPVPNVTFPDYVFDSPSATSPHVPILWDAEDPEGLQLTYHDYVTQSKRLAAGLRKAGLVPGERVLVFSRNTTSFPVLLMGIILAGGIFTGANPDYTASELAHQLRDAKPKFLFCEPENRKVALDAAGLSDMRPNQVFDYNYRQSLSQPPEHGTQQVALLLATEEEGEELYKNRDASEMNPDRTIALNYSSGTTGLPKGVEISHRNQVANTEALIHLVKLDPEYGPKNKRTTVLLFWPMFHAMAQTLLIMSMKRGNAIYVMRKFNFREMLQNIQKFRVTDLVLVPPIVINMVKDPQVQGFDLSSVERVSCGAAPLSRQMCEEFEKLWPKGNVYVKQGWGMTESTSLLTSWGNNERPDPASVGRLAPNVEVKVVDENGGPLEENQSGQFLVRGPNITKGYWNRPHDTQETISPDGWLKTGDIGYIDADGKVFIMDRLKEMIKVKGNQVAPAELEAVLLSHDSIADAAVIGVQRYDRPFSTTAMNTRGHLSFYTLGTSLEIYDFVKVKVIRYKWLDGGIQFVDSIPKNPSGKILRKVLRESAARAQKPAFIGGKL
ncbi:4-coumarate-CoA ligase 2 [Pyrenochaeta sp. DS3sAY3a]|nr:4-coumarate-CoA ligase 2 [Pyrenochaeta sp. DS3sAY3a]